MSAATAVLFGGPLDGLPVTIDTPLGSDNPPHLIHRGYPSPNADVIAMAAYVRRDWYENDHTVWRYDYLRPEEEAHDDPPD